MNEEEIANLVTRLSLDTDDLEKGHLKAMAIGSAIGTGIAHAIESAAAKAMSFGRDVLGAFTQAEQGSIKLDSAIRANGHNVETVRAQYEEFAASIQKVTVLDDDAVLSVLRLAESHKLSGAAAIRAAKDAISLAAVNDSNAESMLRVTAAVEKGEIKQAMLFAKRIEQLKGIRDEQKFVTEYARLVAAGFDVAQANAGSFSGVMAQMHNALENLYEDFGKIIADALKPFYMGLQVTIDWMKGFSETSKVIVVAMGAIAVGMSGLIGLGVVFNAVWSPVTLTVVAVAGAGALLTTALVFMEEQTRVFSDSWRMLLPLFEDVKQLVKQLTGQSFNSLTDVLKEVRPFLMLVAIGFKEVLAVAIDVARASVAKLKAELGPVPALLANMAAAMGLFAGPDLQNLGAKFGTGAAKDRPKEDKYQAAEGHGQAKKNVEALQKSAVSLTTSLQEQVATFGMSARAASIYKLEAAGLTDELKSAHTAAQKLATMERNNALTKQIVDQATALQQETESIRAQTAALEGVRGAQGATAAARKEALEIAKDQMEVQKLIDQGAKDGDVEALQQKQKMNREAQKNFEATQEGMDLMDKYKSRTQKFAEEQAHLQDLFNQGKVDALTYQKAIADLQNQINKPLSTDGINASIVGSAEGFAKLQATRQALRTTKLGPLPAGANGPGFIGTKGPIASQTKGPMVADAKQDTQKTLDYLKELVELARAKAGQFVLEVERAGLI